VPSKPELNNRFAETDGTGVGEGVGEADDAGVTAEPDVTTAEPQPVVSAPARTSHIATGMWIVLRIVAPVTTPSV
jgi:hypothetical protein